MRLRHRVQRTAILEPLELRLVERMVEFNIEGLAAICWMHSQSHWLANCNLSAQQVDLVVWLDLVVVRFVREGEWQHTLLLEVGLVNTGE